LLDILLNLRDKPSDTSIFYEYNIRDAIENKYLCDYQFIFPIFEQDVPSTGICELGAVRVVGIDLFEVTP
jgi:hypothetical protein